jgi:5'-deoxynucleotidase YfbR-like HD superfamily hydrolase
MIKGIPANKNTKAEYKELIDFLLKIEELKEMPRKIWSLMGIKNSETVAGHTLSLVFMAWLFGHKHKKLNLEKLLKMALCHEITSIYTGDLITPYRKVANKDQAAGKMIFQKWPRLFKEEKEKKFAQDYQKEKKALQKLTKKLSAPLRDEFMSLFDDYKTLNTPEARYLNQLNVLAVLLKGIQYNQADPTISIDFLWEWVFEKCDDNDCFLFIEELEERFYKDKKNSKGLGKK